jgi:glyoxylase-like metal-dependent hydrolase (beta-lactamase superfamily II)
VITNGWHERDARYLAEQLGAQVFVPPPDAPNRLEGQQYAAGALLPAGVEAHTGSEPPYDHVLWIESRRAIVIGDSLVDNGTGLTLFDRWIPKGHTREQVLERLRPLLDLPVELVLPTHGAPTDRAALERALAG